MNIKYATEILMGQEDTASFTKLFKDFTTECKRQGLWAKAQVTVTPDADSSEEETFNLIRLELIIDDSLRTKPGTKPKQGKLTLKQMAEMKDKGMKATEIAAKAGISRATFYRRMEEYQHKMETYEY